MKDNHIIVIFDGNEFKYTPDFYTMTMFKKVKLSDINVEKETPQHSAKCYNANRGLSRIRGD